MKSSDLKVVAIILAIALFFTIVTSNAVSIASVVLLATGGIGNNAADVATPADNGNQSATPSGNSSTATPSSSSSTATPSSSSSSTVTPSDSGNTASTPTDNGNTASTPTDNGNSASTPTNNGSEQKPADNGNGQKPADNGNEQKPADNGNEQKPADNGAWDTAKCFNFYKDACNKIKTTGAAGHTRKEWQELKSLNLGAASSILEGVLKGFMTSEADAGEAVSEKGSDDAKKRICPCDCDMSFVASATKEDLANGNYKITIIMKDENTPAKGSKGIASMATGILYMEDVMDTVVNDATVSKIVKSLDKGELYYQAYTIVAEMTKDGKFVDINHFTTGQLSATATVKLVGQISGDGTLDFHSHWYNFNY